MSCAIGLTSATHLRYMHSEHPFMLEIASSPPTKLPCSPPRTIPAFGSLARRWWLHELSSWRQCRQHFGTLQTISGLRAVGVGSGRARAEAADHRLSCTAVQALLEAARGPTSSSPRAGCTLGTCILGGLIRACSALSARISRPLVTAWPPCRTRSDCRWRDLQHRCVDGSENQDLHMCAV